MSDNNLILTSDKKLIRNSIPKQVKSMTERLGVKDWNDVINILRQQTNATVDYVEALRVIVVKEVLEDVIPRIPVGPKGSVCIGEGCGGGASDDSWLQSGTPGGTYVGKDYGKAIGGTFEI